MGWRQPTSRGAIVRELITELEIVHALQECGKRVERAIEGESLPDPVESALVDWFLSTGRLMTTIRASAGSEDAND